MRRLAHTCAAAALLASATYAPANAKIYALVIGIDEYNHIPSLAGAVNDADDITGALEELGAEVTTLLNRDASRQAIFDAWADKAAQVGPGDLLIVSYAGHGSNEPEFWEGSEGLPADAGSII